MLPRIGGFTATGTDSSGPAPMLVIDDEPTGAASRLRALAGAGYPTVAESDGDAVLRLVRSRAMRLVVSEIYIPCSEGRCVVTALKADRNRLPRLRVLVHSRHINAADDAWALAAGWDAILHKPAHDDELVREIRRMEGVDTEEPGTSPAAGGPA